MSIQTWQSRSPTWKDITIRRPDACPSQPNVLLPTLLPTPPVKKNPNIPPCDTGSSMRSLTGSETWGWFMCQHMHVMSLELPPQQSNISVITACFYSPAGSSRVQIRTHQGIFQRCSDLWTKHISCIYEHKRKVNPAITSASFLMLMCKVCFASMLWFLFRFWENVTACPMTGDSENVPQGLIMRKLRLWMLDKCQQPWFGKRKSNMNKWNLKQKWVDLNQSGSAN